MLVTSVYTHTCIKTCTSGARDPPRAVLAREHALVIGEHHGRLLLHRRQRDRDLAYLRRAAKPRACISLSLSLSLSLSVVHYVCVYVCMYVLVKE